MQPKNLGWKFAFVALLIAMCVYSITFKELRQGIDLKGGHILTFEVQTAQRQRAQMDQQIEQLTTELLAAPAPTKPELQKRLDTMTAQRDQLGKGEDSADIVQRVISRLKRRIDPNGLFSLEWRPVGRNRFEVRMPLGTEEAQRAKQAYLSALQRLQDSNIQRSAIQVIVTLAEAGQGQAQELANRIEQASRGDPQRKAALQDLAMAAVEMAKAQSDLDKLRTAGGDTKAAEARYDNAMAAYDKSVRDVLATNINTEKLGQVLDLYVPAREQRQITRKEREERERNYNQQLSELRDKHPSRTNEINAVVTSYVSWAEKRSGLDDPADLKRLVAKAGVLEFRIAPVMYDSAADSKPRITPDEYNLYVNRLAEEGPMAGHTRNDEHQWFEVRGTNERLSTNLVRGRYAGKLYVLLLNRRDDTMLQDDPKRPWSLTARPSHDQLGRPAVGFQLDERGARRMGNLTSNHINQYMAILLDDVVYSAPVIRAAIYDNGIIEGDFTQKQVSELVNILEAGALEGRVIDTPVSEKTIAPSLGEDNRKAGVRAAFWALVGTGVFMMMYYWLAGSVAVVAMLLNLLLVLGAMSFVEAVFTLPGIAGLILSTAMAVDANVLIYERLREEQAKTQSLRMAFRNAYHNAFSAIFDSNITTLIVAIILVWVGTEEIKGFGITLGLGVLFNLFTAISVTRWIFQSLLEGNLIKNRIRMFGLIGVPKIDWMGKRWWFWGFSIVTSLLGLAALFSQGKDILGIEFSSGTLATFKFQQAAQITAPAGRRVYPDRGTVQDDLGETAKKLLNQAQAQEQQLRQKLASAGESRDELTKQLTALQYRLGELRKFVENDKVETLLETGKADDFLRRYDRNADGVVDKAEAEAGKLPATFLAYLDKNGDGKLERKELAEKLPERNYQVSTTTPNADLLREIVRDAFGDSLETPTSVTYQVQKSGEVAGLGVALDPAKLPTQEGMTVITPDLEKLVRPEHRAKFTDFMGGAMFVIADVNPPLTEQALMDRTQAMRLQPDFADYQFNRTAVIALTPAKTGESFSSFAVLAWNPNSDYSGRPAEWKSFAGKELSLLQAALGRSESLESVTSFDAAVAGETAQLAIIACVVSWLAIIVYLWVRFGQLRWGLAAVICLIHDVIIAVGLVALSAWLANTHLGRALLIDLPFKVDMTVIAAFLTIIGYSVNDTIVVFDRIRENRGKLKTVDAELINHSINQTLSRTLLTGTSTLIALMVMYIFGGEGIHAFTYAMLGGFVVGTYSSIAVAAPILLGIRGMLNLGARKGYVQPAAPTAAELPAK